MLGKPIYLVSPQLLVTKEHIMSESASTSSSFAASFGGSGDVTALVGLSNVGDRGALCRDVAVSARAAEAGVSDAPEDVAPPAEVAVFSARRLSKVPRSVCPLSSSERSPASLSRCSIRPSLFSRPSMYFALSYSQCP